MQCDNAVIHYFPHEPYIVKAAVNLRIGSKIVWRSALKDDKAAVAWLEQIAPEVPYKIIVYK